MNFLRHVWRFVRAIIHNHRVGLAITAFVVLFILGAYWTNIFISIAPGHAGVVWHRFSGTDIRKSLSEGLHIVSPLDSVYIYELRAQNVYDTVKVLTADGMEVSVCLTNTFYPMSHGLGNLHRFIGPNYYERAIRPTVFSSVRRVFCRMNSDQVIALSEHNLLTMLDSTLNEDQKYQGQGWSAFNESVNDEEKRSDKVDDLLRETKHDLESVFHHTISLRTNVLAIGLPSKVVDAIADKMVEKQHADVYEFILRKEEAEVGRRKIEAEGLRQFREVSGVDPVTWRGIKATEEIAKSPNSKTIIIGTSRKDLPVLLNGEAK